MFGRALLFLGPVLVIVLMLGALLTPGEETNWSHADLIGVVLGGLALALTAGNVLVSRRRIDTVVGCAGRLPAGLLAGWAVVLVALVVVAPVAPLPAMQLTVVTAVASVAASFVPALSAARTAVLNAVVLVATVVLAGVSDLPALVAGLVVISSALWACWSNAWLLRVLLDLQAAHEDRAALTVAEERVPEPAVLPAVAVGPAVV